LIKQSPSLKLYLRVRYAWYFIFGWLPLTCAALYIYVVPNMIDLISNKAWVVVSLFLLMTSLTLAILLIQKHYKLKAVSQNKKI